VRKRDEEREREREREREQKYLWWIPQNFFFPNQNPIEAEENIRPIERWIDECDVSNLEFSFLWGKMLFLHGDDNDDEKYLF
jgi:hypothetical protein